MFFLLEQFLVSIIVMTDPYPVVVRYDEEKYFEDPATRLKCPFPSLNDMPSVALSVIIPAYCEELRCKQIFIIYLLIFSRILVFIVLSYNIVKYHVERRI